MPAPGFTEVQSKSGTGSGTSITVTLTSAPSSSNLVVIEVWANANVTFTAPTGFTVPSGGSTANAKSSGAVMAAASQTATSYTVTLSASDAHIVWTVREWSGASGLGAASFGYYTASSSAITLDPTLTPQNANSQLIGNFGVIGEPTETINTSGWTNEFNVLSGSSYSLFSDQYGSAAGSASIGESATFSAITNAGNAAGIYEILPSGGTPPIAVATLSATSYSISDVSLLAQANSAFTSDAKSLVSVDSQTFVPASSSGTVQVSREAHTDVGASSKSVILASSIGASILSTLSNATASFEIKSLSVLSLYANSNVMMALIGKATSLAAVIWKAIIRLSNAVTSISLSAASSVSSVTDIEPLDLVFSVNNTLSLQFVNDNAVAITASIINELPLTFVF